MQTQDLERAYSDFLAAAKDGNYPQPTNGGWSAELVLAHLIVSDREIAAAIGCAIAGNPPAFDNSASQAEPLLHAVVEAAGSWAGLLDALERTGQELIALASRMTDEQAAMPIPIKVVSDGRVVIDAEAPLASLVRVPVDTHLRMHLQQLAALSAPHVEATSAA